MPAPWYRKGHPAPTFCCTEGVSSLALHARSGPEGLQPTGDPRLRLSPRSRSSPCASPRPELLSDPVADVLEWLRRYDFRDEVVDERRFEEEPSIFLDASDEQPQVWGAFDEVCDEFVREESTRAESDDVILQVPKHTGTASRQPGRVLHPARTNKERPPEKLEKPAAAARQPSPPRPREVLDRGPCPCEQMGSRPAPSIPSTAAILASCGLPSSGSRPGRDFFEEEEEEWETRRRRSGTVGRLVVYREGDSPREDVILRDGGRHHIVVAGLREGGQAAKVGVRAGDRLASINGSRDFFGKSAASVQESLRAPVILVFVGFVGKLQAEVRLARVDDAAGIPARERVLFGLGDNREFEICEERVFDVGSASLFLTVQAASCAASPGAGEPLLPSQLPPSVRPIFELQQLEANFLLRCAMAKLRVHEESGTSQAPHEQAGCPQLRPQLRILATASAPEIAPLRAPSAGEQAAPSAAALAALGATFHV